MINLNILKGSSHDFMRMKNPFLIFLILIIAILSKMHFYYYIIFFIAIGLSTLLVKRYEVFVRIISVSGITILGFIENDSPAIYAAIVFVPFIFSVRP